MKPTPYFNPPKRLPFQPPVPPPGKPLISLAINESAYGCSPAALEAAEARLKLPNRYPDPSSGALRAAISQQFDLDPERLVCGNGDRKSVV